MPTEHFTRPGRGQSKRLAAIAAAAVVAVAGSAGLTYAVSGGNPSSEVRVEAAVVTNPAAIEVLVTQAPTTSATTTTVAPTTVATTLAPTTVATTAPPVAATEATSATTAPAQKAAPTTKATTTTKKKATTTTKKPVTSTTKATTTSRATTTTKATTTTRSTTTTAPAVAGSVVFPSVGDVPSGLTSIGEFRVVCYSGGTRTYSGEPTGTNVVAVDRSVIPIWTEIYIDGVGWRTALDTGSAIKGNILDIWMPTLADCRAWGSRNRAVFARDALSTATTTTTVPPTTTTAPSAPPDTEPQ